jgi:serine phosphatase RsbU (regulator of sigma subunit)
MTEEQTQPTVQPTNVMKQLDSKRAARNLIFLFLTFTALDIGVFAVLAFINQGDIVRNQAEMAGRALGFQIAYLIKDEENYIDRLMEREEIEELRILSADGELLAYKPEDNNHPPTSTEMQIRVKSSSADLVAGRNFSIELDPESTFVRTVNSVVDENGVLEAVVIGTVPIPSIREDFAFLWRQFIFAVGVILLAHLFFLLLANRNLIRPLRTANTILDNQATQLQEQYIQLKTLNDALEEGLSLGWNVQKSLLPKDEYSFEHGDKQITVVNTCIPMEKVSGDFLTWEKMDDGSIILLHADVVGHGVASALVTTMTKVAFNNAIQHSKDPGALMTEINNVITPLTLECDFYLTAFLAHYNPAGSELEWVNANHPAAFLWHEQSNEVEELDAMFPQVGIMDGLDFETQRTPFKDTDRLLTYSDGITECMDPDGAMFGDEPLKKLFHEKVSLSSKEIHDIILQKLFEFRGSAPANDDVSILVLELGKKQ